MKQDLKCRNFYFEHFTKIKSEIASELSRGGGIDPTNLTTLIDANNLYVRLKGVIR